MEEPQESALPENSYSKFQQAPSALEDSLQMESFGNVHPFRGNRQAFP